MSDPVVFRVFKLPQSIVVAMRDARDRKKQTNAQFVADTVTTSLPILLIELQRIGFAVKGETVPTRLPFTDESASLGQLKEAAELTGIPVTTLFELCVKSMLRSETMLKRRRRSVRATKETPNESPKVTRRKPRSKPADVPSATIAEQ